MHAAGRKQRRRRRPLRRRPLGTSLAFAPAAPAEGESRRWAEDFRNGKRRGFPLRRG